MNNRDLTVFATAARLGSITRAAHALATVQSNVTARIRLLEDELGVPLFHRHPRGITLTAKGQDLLPYAEQMIALARKAKESVSGRREAEGTLRIGSLQSTASVRLPAVLKRYIARHRRVDIAIETGTPVELTERVLARAIDGAFMAGPVRHRDLNAIPAFVEEVVVVTPRAYRSIADYLARGRGPKILVFKEGCFYRSTLENYLSTSGVDLLQEMEFGTLDGILGCVGAGLGITMMPRSVVERSALRREVRMHPLPKGASRIETVFVTRRDAARSTALERFVETLAARESNGDVN
ncbi:MAG TPA: LysR substrate-binding domain-containing protein [Rudaea sp.]